MLNRKEEENLRDLVIGLGRDAFPAHLPHALAIGVSTGGPQALQRVFTELRGSRLSLPIYITQHMPAQFTGALAEQLTRAYGSKCVEGHDGEDVESGTVYIAPGNYHMELAKKINSIKIKLSTSAEVNFCRPSVDVMLESLVPIYGDRLLVIIMTGMGQDGLDGCRKAHAAGATIIAQDAASSAVWGMPRAVAEAGICKAVLPLGAISHYIKAALGDKL